MTGKQDLPTNAAEVVGTVFLVPYDFAEIAKPLNDLAVTFPTEVPNVAMAFSENLHSVIKTLSIPYKYTWWRAHALRWQAILMAERIRARRLENEAEREPAALKRAEEVMASYLNGKGRDALDNAVLVRLLSLMDDPESLDAARELTRQGIVLTWSAIEVLARDAFVHLLDRKPSLSDQLFANRKPIFAERIDWATLARYDLITHHSQPS